MESLPPEQIEASETLRRGIENLRGVIGCMVISDASGALEEVNVLASTYRSERLLMPEIKALCHKTQGYSTRCKISLTPMEDETETALNRLSIAKVEWSGVPGSLQAKVELTDGEKSFTGESGSVPEEDRLKTVAQATVKATEQYLAGQCRLQVKDLVWFEIGRYQGAMVSLDLVSPDGVENLIGSALIKQDEDDAVIKAILGTINRSILQKYGPREGEACPVEPVKSE